MSGRYYVRIRGRRGECLGWRLSDGGGGEGQGVDG